MKLFYQSPVPWEWLRQRPHFVAEGLAELGIDVFWFYAARIGKCRFRRIKCGERLVGLELPVLPFASRCRIIEWVNKLWVSWWLRRVSVEVVVATNPATFPWLPSWISGGLILYDCMDMHAEFFTGHRHVKMMEEERKLVSICSHIIVSSNALRSYLICTYRVAEAKMSTICNGIASIKHAKASDCRDAVVHPSIAYFGTIDFWLDWASVIYAAEKHSEWHFDFFGSVVSKPCKLPANVVLHGPIPHNQVGAQMANSDILIMPFVHCRLIDGVDPVKMYEYLATGRPIVSSWWQELEKFRPFPQVTFYGDCDSLESVVAKRIMSGKVYDIPITFLQAHSWKKLTRDFLDDLLHCAQNNAENGVMHDI